jgi:hypothetical protein
VVAFYRNMGLGIPDNHPKGTGHNAGPAPNTTFFFPTNKALFIPIYAPADALHNTGSFFAVTADHRCFAFFSLFHEQPSFGRSQLTDRCEQGVLGIGMGDAAFDLTGFAA